MANSVPYLNFAQNGQEAITFYKGVFGGDAEVQFEGERVLHLDFQAGGIHFMGSDPAGLEQGNGYSLVLNCDSEEQLRDFYTKLVDGGRDAITRFTRRSRHQWFSLKQKEQPQVLIVACGSCPYCHNVEMWYLKGASTLIFVIYQTF